MDIFRRGPQGPRGLKCQPNLRILCMVSSRGPQGPRGLKYLLAEYNALTGQVAVRKDRED